MKLHDGLYQGLLQDQLHIDIPYIPHISVGLSTDPWECKQLADTINQSDLRIAGWVDALDVVTLINRKVKTISQIKLL